MQNQKSHVKNWKKAVIDKHIIYFIIGILRWFYCSNATSIPWYNEQHWGMPRSDRPESTPSPVNWLSSASRTTIGNTAASSTSVLSATFKVKSDPKPILSRKAVSTHWLTPGQSLLLCTTSRLMLLYRDGSMCAKRSSCIPTVPFLGLSSSSGDIAHACFFVRWVERLSQRPNPDKSTVEPISIWSTRNGDQHSSTI